MNFPLDFQLMFHMLVFVLRKYLEAIHTAQFVSEFYLETVDELSHATIISLIWLLHPTEVARDLKALLLRKRNLQGLSETCLITNWVSLKALKLFTGLNYVPIQAQTTETAIYNCISGFDLKQVLDCISTVPERLFSSFKVDQRTEAEADPLAVSEETKGFFIHLWPLPRKPKPVFQDDSKAQKAPSGRATSAPPADSRTRPSSKDDKINEVGELEDDDIAGVPAPKTSASAAGPLNNATDMLPPPTFLDLKSMWGRKRRPHLC
ncbi:hypothetical protein METBIDRAFT_220238 [Metschnikowia bicuspidata var. bicuspidata NRRL YB-4993]|uniref:Uncharacterized protein n=1 Tax=Metschnikowia bicuspidata var. bicuspidata NRRL YB-4993 TaxID=869754 RepID=A0A1A0H5A5_9ASCO|nr:hypothetical protein METBIDRAFT_220238 [Metschnikowia bicuspidata var. bicuspidata NRRL YB-4993]OBA19216.1 hypothetical protein METBIDRAFT_220238 [Metschnikowia bicuspidata var. bicuspidata NRRL YB-4993]